MHEVSLGQTIRDYLTGEHIEQTTYEDLRQALARILVEERGCPKENIEPKAGVHFPVTHQGKTEEYCRTVDLAVYDNDRKPLLIILFCPGQINTYRREALAAARLFAHGPVPLVAVTDTREAMLIATQTDTLLAEGMSSIPRWESLQQLAAEHSTTTLGEEQRDREQRILFTYSEFIKTCCGESVCML